MLAFFMSGTAVFGQSDSLSLSSGTATPGGAASLNLSLSSPSGSEPAAIEWTFAYSTSDIVAISASAGAAATAAGKSISCAGSPASYMCLLTGLNGNVVQNGVVAVLTVTLSAASSGTTISVANPLGASASASAIQTTATGGTITITGVPSTLTSLSCNPGTVASGASTSCNVSLNHAASSATTVALSDNNAPLTIPASVTVSAGASSATFVATVGTLTTNQSATITATLNGAIQTATLSLVAPTLVSTLACNPTNVNSGTSTACTVTLNQAAPLNTAVALSDNNPIVTTPPSVTVSAGATSATFSASAGAVTAGQTVVVTASLGGSSLTATLTLIPPITISYLQCALSSLGPNAATACLVMLSQPVASAATIALSSNNPALTLPASVVVAAGTTAGNFAATAGAFTTTETAVITATLGASSLTASETLAPLLAPSSVLCSPSSVNSGASTTCTVTLNQSAPSGGSAVAITTNNTVLTVPPSVTVPAKSTSTTFNANLGAITTTQTALVTANLSGSSQTADLTLVAPTLVSTLACSPTSVYPGASTTCTVTLNQPAPTGGSIVALGDNNALLTVPASVTVAAGAISATFAATAGIPRSTQAATVTATLSSTPQSATLSLLAPVLVSALACNAPTLTAGNSAACTLTLSGPAPTGGLAVAVSASSPALIVPATVSVRAGSSGAKFMATATATVPDGGTTETVSVTATLHGLSQAQSLTLLLCPCSLWPSTAQPVNPASTNNQAIEVGMQFTSNVAGYVTGVRFFKATANTGLHVGNLWTASGTNLAKVAFTNETASGWQTAYFSAPVEIAANTTYVISYHTRQGHNAADNGAFTTSLGRAPIQALADGHAGPNGLYTYGSTAFPATGASATNYWVDVILNTSAAIGTAPPVSVWASTAAPTTPAAASAQPQELGLTFLSDVPGYITGARFYKSSQNLGPHYAYLWTSTGTLLASVEFTRESASGWQQANFAAPVAIGANTPYVVSYWSPQGYYADDARYFATAGVTNQMLYAPPDGQYGPNSSYATTNIFPAGSSGASNYWVDVVFSTAIQ